MKNSLTGWFARKPRDAAFTLIEVTPSIGIIAFAFLAIFGRIPSGLGVFRQAMDTSVGAQIGQHVLNDAAQTDFSELIKDASGTTIISGSGNANYSALVSRNK